MELEQEIKQNKFRNERQKALVNILFTYGFLSDKIRDILIPFGLTMQQFNILRILRGSHPVPLSTSDIKMRMLDKSSDTSRIVDRLVAKKLVKKTTCPTDKRLVDVMISNIGLEMLEKIDICEEKMDELTFNLTDDEVLLLSSLLNKLRG